MEQNCNLRGAMDAETISKNGASSKSLKSRRKHFSKLSKVAAIATIVAICTAGLLKYAWASDFTEELAKKRLNGNEDYTERADEISNKMSNVLGTNKVAQICIVVHDLEKTAKAYSDFFGLPYSLFISEPYEIAQTVYNGQPTPTRLKMAIFEFGNLTLELAQPDNHPSAWREDLDKNGEGFHHLAFFVKDTDNVLKNLESMGMKTRHQGSYGHGRYAYVDSKDQLKITIETLEDYPK